MIVNFCHEPGADPLKIPVDLWTVGDDNLTQSFSGSLSRAILESKYFELKNNEIPGNMEILMEENVSSIDECQNIIGFEYNISVKNIHFYKTYRGSCKLNNLHTCSANIIKSIEGDIYKSECK